MAAIGAMAERLAFVLEDAVMRLAAAIKASPWHCRYSAITVFSFHPVKIITTGEGGLATANNPVLAQRMQGSAAHGMCATRNALKGHGGLDV